MIKKIIRKDMEVHHHPNVEKKNFKEYFLEFVMIFLAVTMGFFAESLREHINDHAKSEQYIQSLVEDLESDTARMDDIIQFDEAKITGLNSMYQCYDTVTNNLKATSCMGGLIKFSKVNRPFLANDRTITQLANAGGFRLLTKDDADSILSYEKMYRNVHDFETTIYQEAQDNVRNTLNELANFKVVSPLENVSSLSGSDSGSSSLNGPLLFSDDRKLLNKWFNQLQLYLRVTKAQSLLLNRLQQTAANLINFYQNKHHLK
ncbi:MAG TPA: hypothetical protein VLS85_10885 [Hanamia sp.]|nr:hypothetical protein [Hanamia sp.]